jgi:ABC-type microcin C transport system duplicated ATPase subunit YejF
VQNLRKYYLFNKGILLARTLGSIKAVDDISFTIRSGETLGGVGESGCGRPRQPASFSIWKRRRRVACCSRGVRFMA